VYGGEKRDLAVEYTYKHFGLQVARGLLVLFFGRPLLGVVLSMARGGEP
jgi:hypothetical protein